MKDIFLQLGEALIHSQSGHLQVFKSGFYAAGSRSPEKFLIPEPERFKQSIEGFDGVEDVTARLYFSGLLNNGRSDVPVSYTHLRPTRPY